MAQIQYTPAFKHQPKFIDNETIVQAGGPNGFNKRFDDLESEFKTLSTVVGQVNAAITSVQQLEFLQAQPVVDLGPQATSAEFDVETYDRSTLPTNIDRVYFAIIFPASGPTPIQHTFLYRTGAQNKVNVKLQFFNPGATPAKFGYRILALTPGPS